MTSVLDVVDCAQCNGRAFYEFQTRTLAATTFCPRCGYRDETHPIRKRKTNAGDLIYRTTKRQGHGAYLLKHRNGVSEIGALHRPLNPQTIVRFKRDLKQPGIDAARSFLTRWNPKRQHIEMVVGRFPRNLP